MGLNMTLEQSEEQARSTQSVCQAEVEGYQALQRVISDFAEETEKLTGKAYDSAKAYYSAVLLPLAQGGELYSEALSQAIAKLPEEYQNQVDTKSWSEDELLRLIQREEDLISQLDDMNQKISRLTISADEKSELRQNNVTLIRGHHANKRVYETILDDLRSYDSYSVTLFNELETIKIQITTGLSQIGSSWNASSGTFTIPDDLSWATTLTSLSTSKKSVEDIEKADIINDYMQTYGFDRETATILFDLQQGIIKQAQKEDWSNQKVIYEFNRIVASFVVNYGGKRWFALSGTLTSENLKELCKNYGLSLSDVKILQEGISRQHMENMTSKDFAHEAVQLAAFTEESWSELNVYSIYHVASHMLNKGIYHYTSIFGTSISIPVPIEKYEISFKGDIDSGRYDDADFNSDLDAINTYQRMCDVDNVEDIFKINTKYNSDVITNQVNRVQEFYQNLGKGNINAGKEIAKVVVTDIGSLGHVYITWGQSNEDKTENQEAFFNYLERGEKENVK
ncbi:LXG domain-containing protein [Streptococcus gallolyticus subsp. gallolyticus]|uniref:LXG domain-containing protein n=1 Tax=Streptococcus gallolyticus TaxID=315405 RepID=UPI00209721B9|nr:LXG domain-containing protein [Streptococcus gallolyticus]MCO7178317.1 LXG domain-containing protein [Streptococcus gallolyticus]